MCTTSSSTSPRPRRSVRGTSCGRCWPNEARRQTLWLAVLLVAGLVCPLGVGRPGHRSAGRGGGPVPAAVILNNVGTARVTDLDGRLQLDSVIRQGDTLEIRSLGFGSRTVAMPVRSADLAVQLAPESVALSEVIVATVEPARQTMRRRPSAGSRPCPLPGKSPSRSHAALGIGAGPGPAEPAGRRVAHPAGV